MYLYPLFFPFVFPPTEIELEAGCTYWVNIRTTSIHYPMVVSAYCPFPVSFQTLDSRTEMDALLKDLCVKELAAKGTEEGSFGKEGLELKKLQMPYGILIGYYNNTNDTKLKEQVSGDTTGHNEVSVV